MMRIKDAIKTQNILREDIQTYYKKGQYEQFLELVNTFAEFTTHFNHEMADGTIVSFRETSTSDGSPVVEINIQKSSNYGDLKQQKIHFVLGGNKE